MVGFCPFLFAGDPRVKRAPANKKTQLMGGEPRLVFVLWASGLDAIQRGSTSSAHDAAPDLQYLSRLGVLRLGEPSKAENPNGNICLVREGGSPTCFVGVVLQT